MEGCLFCKIAAKEIKSDIIYEDQDVVGFKDIAPQAKTHLLFVNKTHTSNINELSRNADQLTLLFNAISCYTRKSGLDECGFRLVTNLGVQAGQSVFHTHIHLLAGEPLGRFGR